ncbi:DNA polymerase beta domain protein region [Paenibacillus algicola]|uniref:DNA polymerase beta domain protein region n=1 Tax=Paenibacillus algicola TaxID=2565926 RepID=A0A4P8XKU0_9BACL|nr:nucleotidyltransferase domain-containing protein [Paenibacillus algicola]QCT03357.1 DNA polymerase beta domain protein region [Paenibacillus algicola]
MKRQEPLEAARQVVQEHYRNCLLAVLGGSAARGEANEHSDLDIVIVDDGATDDFDRRTVQSGGWVVEIFLLHSSGFEEMFDAGVVAANPTLQIMLTEGKVIVTTPEGEEVRKAAQRDLDYGPMPLTSYDIAESRYTITEYMMDLVGAARPGELYFTAQKLSTLLSEFYLRVHLQWVGEGKTLFRRLESFNPAIAGGLEQALMTLYKSGETRPLLAAADEMLAPYGGRMLAGQEG